MFFVFTGDFYRGFFLPGIFSKIPGKEFYRGFLEKSPVKIPGKTSFMQKTVTKWYCECSFEAKLLKNLGVVSVKVLGTPPR